MALKRILGPLDKRKRVSRCQLCAKKQVKCEGGFPCTYCVRRNKLCQTQDRKESTRNLQFVSCSGKDRHSGKEQLLAIVPEDTDMFLSYFLAFIRRCQFTRRCASIGQDLLLLIRGSPHLFHAATAIGALDASRQGSSRTFQEQQSPQLIAFSSYHKSISTFQASLSCKDITQRDDILWGTFLLGLFELMSESSGDRWIRHMLYGSARILCLAGPAQSITPMRQAFLEGFRVLEANRAIIYGEDSFLSKDGWLDYHKPSLLGDVEPWDPFDGIIKVILDTAAFNKRFFERIEAIPVTQRLGHLAIDALGVEGVQIQSTIYRWHSDAMSYSRASNGINAHFQLSLSYYHALLLFLSGDFAYYPYWEYKLAPDLQEVETERHVNAILELAELIMMSDVPGVTLLFPLRVAGAYCNNLQQRSWVFRLLDRVYQGGFVVSNRIKVDLQDLWDYKQLEYPREIFS
ncbi:fungal-specific transcription factor domain-containing protein [Xylogone sp. PMI_703]|nr:fungal-specific transcription factor domain-containing protein [Xylogone sp. PMI_703]